MTTKPRFIRPTPEEVAIIEADAGSIGNPAIYDGGWCAAHELLPWRAARSTNTSAGDPK